MNESFHSLRQIPPSATAGLYGFARYVFIKENNLPNYFLAWTEEFVFCRRGLSSEGMGPHVCLKNHWVSEGKGRGRGRGGGVCSGPGGHKGVSTGWVRFR